MTRKKSTRRKYHNQFGYDSNGTARNKFLQPLYDLCKDLDCIEACTILTKAEWKTVYFLRIHLSQPQPHEDSHLTKDEMTDLARGFHFIYHIYSFSFPGAKEKMTIHKLMAIDAFIRFLDTAKDRDRKKELEVAFAPIIKAVENYGDVTKRIHQHMRVLLFMNLQVDEPHISFHTSFDLRQANVTGIYLTVKLKKHKPRYGNVMLNGWRRPVFQLGYPQINSEMVWLYLPTKWMKDYDFYKGTKTHLPICMQAHVLHRLEERCDIFKYSENMSNLIFSFLKKRDFIIYRNKLMFAYTVSKIKIGYFVGQIVGSRVIIRTFLFLTHHNTPEGNELERLSGLAKDDISYWQIDRLSTFLNTDFDAHPVIYRLFEQVGLSALFKLKNINGLKKSDVHLNVDSLAEFIQKGQQTVDDPYFEEEWDPEYVPVEETDMPAQPRIDMSVSKP